MPPSCHLSSPASHSASRRLAVAPGFRVFFEGAEAGLPMKVTVERAELLKSLGHVHRVVERRNTIPILANVLIKAANLHSKCDLVMALHVNDGRGLKGE